MKRISCLLGGVLLSVAASAQLTVMPSGKTYIGDLPNNTQDPDGVVTLHVFGKGEVGSKARIAIGDYGRASTGSCNVMISEYADKDSDKLWLHGKNGIYQTAYNGTDKDVISYLDLTMDKIYHFNVSIKTTKNINCTNLTASNKVTCKELLNTSDRRLKSDIQPIGNSTANLMKLTGVSYYLHSKDEGEEASLRSGSDNKRDMGLIAQDLMKVYPDLVFEDEEGYYAVNYIGLIPVLIESIKEQQTTIEKLNDKIGKLEAKSIGQLSDATDAVLLQNTPNPFNESTSIEYKIPATATSASIFVYNMEGAQLKEYKINGNGAGSVLIKGSEFAAGMYLYALIVDNELIDTKRMILTK